MYLIWYFKVWKFLYCWSKKYMWKKLQKLTPLYIKLTIYCDIIYEKKSWFFHFFVILSKHSSNMSKLPVNQQLAIHPAHVLPMISLLLFGIYLSVLEWRSTFVLKYWEVKFCVMNLFYIMSAFANLLLFALVFFQDYEFPFR